jgi:PAS domain S-box-containing protein
MFDPVLQKILDSAPVAMVLADSKGRIVVVNSQSEKMFGYDRQEMLGNPLEMLLPERFHGRHALHRAAYSEDPRRREMGAGQELFGRRKDGSEFPVEISLSPMDTEEGLLVCSVVRDITPRKRAEEKFRALLESAPDAMVISDQEGRIVLVNSQAERLFGYRRDEMLEQKVEMLLPDRFHGRHVLHRGAFFQDPRLRPMGVGLELFGRRRDGSEFPVEISLSPIETEQGILVTTAVRDISERKKAQEKALLLLREQEKRAQAEAASRAKDQFLAMVSHELRTPLTAILGWARLLSSGRLDPPAVTMALQVIERNAKAQAQLIEDILDVSRIITGRLRLEVQPVEPMQMIQAALDSVRPAAEAKGIRLQAALSPQAGIVRGDPDRLQQVVWNLLSNAVKFTDRGGLVRVELRRAGHEAEIVIVDTGKGIKRELLPRVFEEFWQDDTSITRPQGGLGLGLAIVRRLVEMHGGSVSVDSQGEGHGATFTVNFPVVESWPETSQEVRQAATAPPEPPPFGCPPSLQDLNVLLVDDEPDARDLLTTILQQCGVRVTAVGSAMEAMAVFRKAPPDLLISDIGMPEEDGYVLIRKIRTWERERGGHVPAIALTAFARVEDRMRVLSSGYQMHVSKPVDPAELTTVVASVARR